MTTARRAAARVAFAIPGRPMPAPRMNAKTMYRQDSAGERARAYLAWKDEVGYRAAIAMRCADLEPLQGRLRVEITIHGMARNYDVENASKALCDAMNGVCYRDDMQIDELLVRRIRSTSEPVSCVRVWEIGE